MADDKKPKIDLKARLGKTAQQTPPPGPVAPAGGVPRASAPVGAGMQGAVPGVPVGAPPPFSSRPSSPAPAIDPSNPLVAVAAPYRPPAPPPQPQAHRIEVDEMAVQHARRGALKAGVVIGLVVAGFTAVIGFVGGQSMQQGSDRKKSVADAKELVADVTKARDVLKTLADKVEAGGRSLAGERKFPDTLAKDLGGLNVDFDGTKLEGRRFSGFTAATAHDLVDFITAVQAINDRKDLVAGLLTRLQKPITDQLAIPAGQANVSQVIVVLPDPSGNLSGFLEPLAAPIAVSKENINLPPKFTFANPKGSGNTELPRYTGGDISNKPAAIYVVPKTFETVCPSATNGQVAQLGAQMGEFVHQIRGEGTPDQQQDVVQDSKPGLIERADKLITELSKVQ
jgi:hypothetical protein